MSDVSTLPAPEPFAPPQLSFGALFVRFLRFGFMAWGGPAAQIAMIRHDLVDQEKWVSSSKFNRALAVYQVLPGPEAHELCVYFGTLCRGRLGGLLAGLGFMLPGFAFMLALSWAYVEFGKTNVLAAAIFAAVQPAVAALIVRAVHRIGSHALHNRWLWAACVGAAIAQLAGIYFAITLGLCGLAYLLAAPPEPAPRIAGGAAILLLIALVVYSQFNTVGLHHPDTPLAGGALREAAPHELLASGLRAGLLTFGGAYTVIPFLEHDAVEVGRWITQDQFLDGIALSGVLPAPLVIFSTFIGYLAGGLLGAFLITLGVFAPAFGFTLIGHELIERVIEYKPIHALLDGVTAGVVGIIAATAIAIAGATLTGPVAAGIFLVGLLVLFTSKSRYAVPFVVLGAAGVGAALSL